MARTDLGSRSGDEDVPEHRLKMWLNAIRKRAGVVRKDLPHGTLARVGDRVIDRAGFARHLEDKLPEELVSSVVMELVVAAAAEHRLAQEGLTATQEQVEAEIGRKRKRFLDDPQVKDAGITFEDFLIETRGLTIDDLRRDPAFPLAHRTAPAARGAT